VVQKSNFPVRQKLQDVASEVDGGEKQLSFQQKQQDVAI